MVEQIRISPEEVRGYGNICEGHTLEDFIVSNSGLAKEKENVHGALTDVYRLVYSLYGLIFAFDKGNKQLYLQMEVADTLSFGFDTVNKQLYLVDVDDTGFNLGFDPDTRELYITDDAPPIVHNYSLAFSAASYVATGGSATLECTLLDNNVPVEGATISVSGSDSSLYTGITNNDGIAQITVNNVSGTVTFTGSYSNVTDTCTVVGSSVIWEDDFNRSSLGSDWVTFGTGANASISSNQLVLSRNGNGRGGVYYNTPVTGDYKITLDFASGDYDNVNLGIAISGTSWKCYEVEPKWYFGYITINSSGTISSTLHEQKTSGITYTSATIVYEVIQDTSIKMYINGTLKGTYNCQDGTTDGYIGVTQCCGRTSKYNSIKVEPL